MLFEHGLLKLRGWEFRWDEHGGGLTINADTRRIWLSKDEVTRLLDLEPY